MIELKEIKKGEFWIYVKSTEILDQTTGEEIISSIENILNKNINVTIDLKDIRIINSKGYSCLIELMTKADDQLAHIYFANIHQDIDELIRSLSLSDES